MKSAGTALNLVKSGAADLERIRREHEIIDSLSRTANGSLPGKERIPQEEFQVGDPVRAIIHKVDENAATGPSVTLSRACPEFVKALFRLEVSEITDGIVEIVGVSRDPGFRSKLAVRMATSRFIGL